MLAGDFTQYASAACNTAGNVTLRGPFVNNRVEPSRLSPAALKIAEQLPTTNDPCGRFNYSQSRPQDEAQYIGKVDLQLTPNHSMFGRVIETRVKWTPPLELRPENLLVSSQGGRDNKAHAITVGDTLVIDNNTVNAVRVAYNKTDIHRIHEPIGFSAPDVGVNTYSYLEDYLLVSVTGGGFQLGGGTESEARFTTPAWQVNDDLTMIRGSHQFGFGANIARWTSLSQANVRSPGQFTFNGTITGLPLADFLTGSLAQLIQATPNSLDMRQLVSRALCAGHLEAVAEGDVELRRALGAGPGAADPERRDLQLQRRSVPGRHPYHAVRQRAARLPVPGRRRTSPTTRPAWRTTGGSSPRASASRGIPLATGACRCGPAIPCRTTS